MGPIVPTAWAQGDATGDVERLNKAALEAYDNLTFEQSRKQLSQALDICESRGVGPDLTAKTHLLLGMVLIAAFNEKSGARLHFQSGLKLRPDLLAPKSLFNPEAQALFDEVKASIQSGDTADGEEEEEEEAPPPPVLRSRPAAPRKRVVEKDEDPPVMGSGIFLSLGGGFGFGLANSSLETNNHASLVSGGGGLRSERPAHLFGELGYSLSSTMLLSAHLRFGFLSGTTQVNTGGGCSMMAPCHPPTSAFAGLAKLTWFFGPRDSVVPYVSVGLGGGYIRHVVEIKLSDAGAGDCGTDGRSTCVDTVKGGPFLLAGGAGFLVRASDSFGVSLGLAAELGLPSAMFNADLDAGFVFQF
jgi:hypothetical protein